MDGGDDYCLGVAVGDKICCAKNIFVISLLIFAESKCCCPDAGEGKWVEQECRDEHRSDVWLEKMSPTGHLLYMHAFLDAVAFSIQTPNFVFQILSNSDLFQDQINVFPTRLSPRDANDPGYIC